MGKCYLLHIGYDGKEYHGWQKQPELPSVQEEIYKVLEELFPNGRRKVFAASRTDSGVHALGQTCKLDIPSRLSAEELKVQLNANLPKDIVVFDSRRIAPSFKITDYVVSKEYLYLISATKEADLPFVVNFEESLDFEKFAEGIKLFIGEHDFKNYQHRSQVKGDFIRKIFSMELVQANTIFNELPDHVWAVRIVGNGFLKQMVRLIMGALVNYSSGKISIESLQESLMNEGEPIGFIAPAEGLILYKIDYPDWKDEVNKPVIDAQNWANSKLPWGFFPNKKAQVNP